MSHWEPTDTQLEIAAIWFVLSLAVGLIAARFGRRLVVWFVISMLVSPALAAILLRLAGGIPVDEDR